MNQKEIIEDKKYKNLFEIWLAGDHYKWRAMRANGIEEEYITGEKSDYEKFLAWSKTVPMTIGNPLYHWTQDRKSTRLNSSHVAISYAVFCLKKKKKKKKNNNTNKNRR